MVQLEKLLAGNSCQDKQTELALAVLFAKQDRCCGGDVEAMWACCLGDLINLSPRVATYITQAWLTTCPDRPAAKQEHWFMMPAQMQQHSLIKPTY